MSALCFRSEWLSGALDDPAEAATFANLTVEVNGDVPTHCFDRYIGVERKGVRVPLQPLASWIARNWWSLLYEPRKDPEAAGFAARHRLDISLRGYLFPAIALWSGGDEMLAEAPEQSDGTRHLRFLRDWPDKIWRLDRQQTENALYRIVDRTIARLDARRASILELKDDWDRVLRSMDDPEEREFCEAAGRLGLDPYDPGIIDLNKVSAGLRRALFRDLCEAAAPDDVNAAGEWLRDAVIRAERAPSIEVAPFGAPPSTDLARPAWCDGYEAAQRIRQRLDKGLHPKQVVGAILGPAESDPPAAPSGALPVEGVALHENGVIRSSVAAQGRSQARFRLCRAFYLGWQAGSEGASAVTLARTRRQQASRAFAAELLAPVELLRERAGPRGLTQETVEEAAAEFGCSSLVIVYQAQSHDIRTVGLAA